MITIRGDQALSGGLLRTLTLEAGRELAPLMRYLSKRYELTPGPVQRCERTYMDTFDWRIHRQGAALYSRHVPPHGLVLRLEKDAQTTEALLGETAAPGFAAELPPGALASALAPVCGCRRVLPVALVSVEERSILVTGRRNRPVARLTIVTLAATDPKNGREGAPMPGLVRVDAVDGRRRCARRLSAYLAKYPPLLQRDLPVADAAVRALGRTPGDYSPKPAIKLSARMPAEAAARTVHRALLSTMMANEDGVRRRVDPEFLHDFRVAVRRTRSVLAQLHGIFPDEITERFKSDFKWLGALTGPVRDLDVYLLKLEDHRTELPAAMQSGLAPLDDFLHRHLEDEHRRLVHGFDSPRYRALMDAWKTFLDTPVAASGKAPVADVPVVGLVSARIWKVYRRVRKMGKAVRADTPARDMHLLRIQCKKLRYLIELFRDLYADADIAQLAPGLSHLQDNLGDLNDLHVQQEKLRGFAHAMSNEGLAPVDSMLAMGCLVHHLAQREALERDRFEACFQAFCCPENHRMFKRLFRRSAGTT